MKSEFSNVVMLSGYVNSSIVDMKGRGKDITGVKFFIAVPRQVNAEKNYVPVIMSCWGKRAKFIKEKLSGKYGLKVTIIGKLNTNVTASGNQTYIVNVHDFCYGWYDIYTYPKYGEIEKAKIDSQVVNNITQQFKGDI